jgi:hypothetical protein
MDCIDPTDRSQVVITQVRRQAYSLFAVVSSLSGPMELHSEPHHIASHHITSHRIASHHITSQCFSNMFVYCTQEDSQQAQDMFMAAAVALEQYAAAIPDTDDVPAGESYE